MQNDNEIKLNFGGGKNGVAPTLSTPILFHTFNRLDTTQRVFNAIRQVQPKQLFVSADGPRLNRQGEREQCEQARAIIKQVDWDCEVKTLFRDENLGPGLAVSSAITWFFEHVEEGIILEDDCLPGNSFFRFCEEMLEKFRDDKRIMTVSGGNNMETWKPEQHDYFFSRFASIWGWATWRRAWQHYDYSMKLWNQPGAVDAIKNVSITKKSFKKRCRHYSNVYKGKTSTWDYQWAFATYTNSGLAVIPSKNLTLNIGFNNNATHTIIYSPVFNMPIMELNFPLRENPFIVHDDEFAKRVMRRMAMTWRRKLAAFLRSNQKRQMLRNFVQRIINKD
ncbi:MAG: nucleotide-diphospho-sugar transferase [Prevotellaceae bacterium]|jgi:hypothetical protein|nr:nucleotide-diphospho-sugar transferase [Prevotellaceae bacterium]